MGFSITADFKVRNYAEAKTKYERIKPIRGNIDDIRPLGARYSQHMRIIKSSDDSYACRLWNTDVATFHKDGRIVFNTGGWDTVSTANFMSACMPDGWWASKYNNVVQTYHSYTGKYYIVQNGFTINSDEKTVSGYAIPTKQVVNRQESKAQREQFKPFLAFAKTFMETLNMEVPHDRDTFWDTKDRARKFLHNPNEVPEEMYLDVLSGLAWETAWMNEPKTSQQIKAKIYRENTVYDTVELPIGTLQR